MNELLMFVNLIDGWMTQDRVIMLYYVFNCAVQSMPDPNGGKFYRWVFKFAHALAGNINVTRKRFPGQ